MPRKRTTSFHNLKDYLLQQKMESLLTTNKQTILSLISTAEVILEGYELLTSHKKINRLLGDHSDSLIPSYILLLKEKHSLPTTTTIPPLLPPLPPNYTLEQLRYWALQGVEFNVKFCCLQASSLEFTPEELKPFHKELKKIKYKTSMQKLQILCEFKLGALKNIKI